MENKKEKWEDLTKPTVKGVKGQPVLINSTCEGNFGPYHKLWEEGGLQGNIKFFLPAYPTKLCKMEYNIVKGDLISLARSGEFDVITHGCNCFCTMGAGIAPQMAKAFGCDKFPLEAAAFKGSIQKLGNIDYKTLSIEIRDKSYPNLRVRKFHHLTVVNAYTQYNYGPNHKDGDKKPLNYFALGLVFQKLNHIFAGQHIGMPKIGCGLAGGDWSIVEELIKKHLSDCRVTVVEYEKIK